MKISRLESHSTSLLFFPTDMLFFKYLRGTSICRVGMLNAKRRAQNLICRVVEPTGWTVQGNLIRMERGSRAANNPPCGGSIYHLVTQVQPVLHDSTKSREGSQSCKENFCTKCAHCAQAVVSRSLNSI